MSNIEKLANAIKSAKPKADELSDLVYGKVTSVSPLRISVEGRFQITSTHIILGHAVKPLSVSMTIDGKTGTATVFRGLAVGDSVRMLRVQNGQLYYVIERG